MSDVWEKAKSEILGKMKDMCDECMEAYDEMKGFVQNAAITKTLKHNGENNPCEYEVRVSIKRVKP